MTYLAKLTLTAFTALALTACGNANETSNSETMDHSKMDHSQMGETKPVSFMVKKGRDNSYRITAICNTEKDGSDCLDTKMEHSGH